MAGAQQDAIYQLNGIRKANGLPALRASVSLSRSATRYARHMIAARYFGHASRIGASSRFGRLGETLALNNGSRLVPGKTISSWMSSTSHRAVLLSSRYRFIGIGIARGRTESGPVNVWVAHVGALTQR